MACLLRNKLPNGLRTIEHICCKNSGLPKVRSLTYMSSSCYLPLTKTHSHQGISQLNTQPQSFSQYRLHSNLALMGVKDPTMMDKVRSKLGLPLSTKLKKRVLKVSSLRLYLCCIELIDHDQFIQEFELPDTFFSWFKISQLHLWMVFCRLTVEGYDGRFVRNNMMYRFWDDVSVKARKMGPSAMSIRREQIQDMSHQIRHALFAYDEGLIDDDRVLAGALWRTFFDFECKDAVHLEKLVHYVRKQMCHLDQQDGNVILKEGLVTFQPLEGHTENTERSSRILKTIYNRI